MLCGHRSDCLTLQQPYLMLVCYLFLQQHMVNSHHGNFAPFTLNEQYNTSNASLLVGWHLCCTQKLKAFRAEIPIIHIYYNMNCKSSLTLTMRLNFPVLINTLPTLLLWTHTVYGYVVVLWCCPYSSSWSSKRYCLQNQNRISCYSQT